jgi:hypothetical protein
MTDIKNMSDSLEKMAELQAFCAAQTRQILDLNRKVNTLEKEAAIMQKRLASGEIEARKQEDSVKADITDEQAICEMQLSILKDRSLEGELTMEESKKVEIFAKLLFNMRNPGKKELEIAKNADTRELLKLVEGGLDDNGKPS